VLLVISLIFIVVGCLYVVFAFRDPPKAIDHFFSVPAIFGFFPEHNRVRLGRITMGVLIAVTGAGWAAREVHEQIHALIAH
jgi:hypothetical protein